MGRKLLRDLEEDATLLNEDVEGWEDPEKSQLFNGVAKDVTIGKSDGVVVSNGNVAVGVGSV